MQPLSVTKINVMDLIVTSLIANVEEDLDEVMVDDADNNDDMADDNIVVNTENDAEMMTSTPCNIT